MKDDFRGSKIGSNPTLEKTITTSVAAKEKVIQVNLKFLL